MQRVAEKTRGEDGAGRRGRTEQKIAVVLFVKHDEGAHEAAAHHDEEKKAPARRAHARSKRLSAWSEGERPRVGHQRKGGEMQPDEKSRPKRMPPALQHAVAPRLPRRVLAQSLLDVDPD